MITVVISEIDDRIFGLPFRHPLVAPRSITAYDPIIGRILGLMWLDRGGELNPSEAQVVFIAVLGLQAIASGVVQMMTIAALRRATRLYTSHINNDILSAATEIGWQWNEENRRYEIEQARQWIAPVPWTAKQVKAFLGEEVEL